METLVATNESLMSTIDEVMKIQQEGREKRREAEGKLVELEDELKQKLKGHDLFTDKQKCAYILEKILSFYCWILRFY